MCVCILLALASCLEYYNNICKPESYPHGLRGRLRRRRRRRRRRTSIVWQAPRTKSGKIALERMWSSYDVQMCREICARAILCEQAHAEHADLLYYIFCVYGGPGNITHKDHFMCFTRLCFRTSERALQLDIIELDMLRGCVPVRRAREVGCPSENTRG